MAYNSLFAKSATTKSTGSQTGYQPLFSNKTIPTKTTTLLSKSNAPSLLSNKNVIGKNIQDQDIFKFPEFLGGGAYFGKMSEPIEPLEREKLDYGKLPTVKDAERDHIVSIFLGGADVPENIKYRKTDKNLIEKFLDVPVSSIPAERRQEGKVKKEYEIYDKYKKGEISRADAITSLKRWEFEQELKPKATDIVKDTVKTFLKSGAGLFTEAIPKTLLKLTPFGYTDKDIKKVEDATKKFLNIKDKQTFEVDLPEPTKDNILSLGLGPINYENLTPESKETIKKYIFLKPEAIEVKQPGLLSPSVSGLTALKTDLEGQRQEGLLQQKIAFADIPGVSKEEKQKAQQEIISNMAFMGGTRSVYNVTEKEAANIIAKAVGSKLTREDVRQILRSQITSGPKLEAYKIMTGDPALKQELLKIVKNEKIKPTEQISKYVKDFYAKTKKFVLPEKKQIIKETKLLPTEQKGYQPLFTNKQEIAPITPQITPKPPQIEAKTPEMGKVSTKKVKTLETVLIEDAKKYKTAEEFVKAQINYLHGGEEEINKFDARKLTKGGELGKGVYFSGDETRAKMYGVTVTNLKADLKNPLIITIDELWSDGGLIDKFNKDSNYTKKLIEQGYDGILVKNGSKIDQGVVFDTKNVLTKSQLTDIWKKAQEKPALSMKKEKPSEITKELVKVRGENFELVGIPTKPSGLKGFKPEIRLKRELQQTQREFKEQQKMAENEIKEFLDSIKLEIQKGIKEFPIKEKNQIRKQIGFQRHTKKLGGDVLARIKKVVEITEWKKATKEQLNKVLQIIKDLKEEDKFLTEKQVDGLKNYLKSFNKNSELVTKRELQERFKEQEEIMNGYISSHISNNIFPTVDIKDSSEIIKRLVNKADYEIRIATKRSSEISQKISDLLLRAERKVGKLKAGENIFKAMSGQNIILSDEEKVVIDVLKKYFKEAKNKLGLEKYRKNYITNLDKTFLEKLVSNNWNLLTTIKSYKKTPESDIPIDIMLALDNIIGSEKFFRFALERKGGIDPTTNIRRIIRTYSSIVENKIALDRILPEGQASVQLLLQPKSAIWLKKYLQNLKGRGLDYNLRNSKNGWLLKGTDQLVNFGYLRLLGLNYWSAMKNIVGGESNSFIFQTFNKYLIGKKRLLTNPIKSYKLIKNFGLLDGSYIEILDKSLPSKIKRGIDLTLYGGMELAEYEIRGSYMLGELTNQEWLTGEITPERFRKILDGIAITQGIYTKIDSPLAVQTTLGRSVMQFGRWKITNTMLARRLLKGAKAEFKRGEKYGKNTRGLLKLLGVYIAGTYLAYESGKAGWKKAKDVAESSTEIINLIIDFFDETLSALTENPVISTLDYILYNYEWLLYYLGIRDKEPLKIKFRNTELYFSSFNTLGLDKEREKGIELPTLPKLPDLPELPSLPKL